MKTSILVYEDNIDLREALVHLINSSGNYVCAGAFDNCRRVISDLIAINPDVILMDIDLPGQNGIEAVRLIREVNKEVKIIMLTVFDNRSHIIDAICAGASGYLLKKHCFEQLFSAITEALTGGAPLSGNVARMILDHVAQTSLDTTADYNLTPRETEILNALVKGYNYKKIAETHNIGFQTVKKHISNIYEKLQVHSKSEAVAKVLKNRMF